MERSTVLAVTDLSVEACEVVRRADVHARDTGGQLVVCHVRSPMAEALAPASPQLAGEVRQHVADALGRVPVGVQIDVRIGWHTRTIVERARVLGASLIVLHDPDRGGRAARIAQRVVAAAPCAVLVVRPPHGFHVLVATDLAGPAEHELVAAEREADALASPVTVMHCVTPPRERRGAERAMPPIGALGALRELAEIAEHAQTRPELAVVGGAPAETIVNAAHGIGADLVVTAARRHTGWERLWRRSVAQTVAARAPCSVLVLRR